jgi:hypothetical protein
MKIVNFLQDIGNICGLTVPAEVNYDSNKLCKNISMIIPKEQNL